MAAYAQRAGISVEAFQDQLGPVLTTEHLAKTIADVVTDESYSDSRLLLDRNGAQPSHVRFVALPFRQWSRSVLAVPMILGSTKRVP